ncbi:MAG TPA: hypothetical protein VGL93_34895 [Streptosporangiaceae bacterium]
MSAAGAAPGRAVISAVVLAGALAATLTAARSAAGRAAVVATGAFMEYYAGVFTLVTLTGAVVFGVLAAQRVLNPRPRIVAQALHRASAIAAVGFLVTHILLKVMEGHAAPADAVVPTSLGWIAPGTIAGDLLVLTVATGAARGRYAAALRPWAWRGLHCAAYVAWPAAVAHGLLAGRSPKPWVTISYVACAAMVVLALLIRSAATARRPSARHQGRHATAAPPPGDHRTGAPTDRTPPAEPRDTSADRVFAAGPGDGGRPRGDAGPGDGSDGGRRRGARTGPSADARDEAFWDSLRAERRDWTRP